MKRSSFKRPQIQRQPSPLLPGTGRGVMQRVGDEVVSVPKGVKAKPGKGSPTAEEARWMTAIVEYGCIACALDGRWHRPAEVHHILRGGRRMGHLYTLPLCPGHHRDGTGDPGLIARHPWKARFERIYGAEMDLLALVQHRVRP